MSQYQAPVRDIQFCLDTLVNVDDIARLSAYPDFSADLTAPILEEAGRFASEVLAPLNAVGDRQGLRYEQGEVHSPEGFKAAYDQFIAAGWNNIGLEADIGGQGLPYILSSAVAEIFVAANKAFSMCPGLTQGAIEAIAHSASEELKALYLPAMVSGQWSGTMNLTEPQAGSDLGLLRTSATPHADGSYRIRGQKIFISYGEHRLTENIIHLVLARLPDAPEGVRGISLFLVPKFLPDAKGQPGARNDLRCISIEHKLGIHASPTCVMAYGESGHDGGAIGWMVGEPHKGLQAMFIMMNAARLTVGIEGLAVSERATQQAIQYARDRVQGKNHTGKGASLPIIEHPDVRRMLLRMQSQTQAMRAMATVIAASLDLARHHPDAAVRQQHQTRIELFTPIFKGWATETGVEVASLGVQVHGGMGFIEETGAAQHLRDARISPIYEGTTGIQANDLLARKLARDQGQSFLALLAEMRETAARMHASGPELSASARLLEAAVNDLQASAQHALALLATQPAQALSISVPLLMQCGLVMGAWLLSRQAIEARQRLQNQAGDAAFLQARLASHSFYLSHVLPAAQAQHQTVMLGGDACMALETEALFPQG